ncbi:tetratricopeptide repeat protein [Haloferula sargassicola]|uniref:Tetratricopeptide repeat protein n=1 Tax=Haloferula sargassicola TaxID=490096 RepID=A0ABP9UMI5_9BACT
MKLGIYIVLGLAIIFGWIRFMTSGNDEIKEIEATIQRYYDGSQEELEEIPTLKDKIENIKGSKTLTGIMLAFLTAGLVGVVAVIDVLPMVAHKFTHAVYDSGEEVEADPMHDAHAKLAQGDFDGAIAAFRDAAAGDPMNRLPYVEIAKLQREQLNNPQAAVTTLREAIEGQEWQENDAAFLMFRLAEIYDEDLADRPSAVTIMQQVMEQFPETRHSANARHKLHEWGVA